MISPKLSTNTECFVKGEKILKKNDIKEKDDNSSEELRVNILPYDPRMKPTDPEKLNTKRTALISLSFFIVLLAWSYFNFKVPLILDDVLNGNPFKDLIKGLIMAIDNIVAVLLQPYFGDLSDRTKSKYGRRMPFIIIGTLTSAVFFVIIPWIRVLAGLVLIILLFDIAMSIYRSASIAILPDYTTEKIYSKASGLQQLIANIGGIFGFAVPLLVGILPLEEGTLWFDAIGFIIVAVLMVILLIVQNLFIKETPTGDKFLEISENRLEVDSKSFKVKVSNRPIEIEKRRKLQIRSYSDAARILKENKNFAYFLGTIIFMYLAFASVESFFSSFAVDFINISESTASTLFLAYSGPMILVAYFVGLVGQSEKIGRKNAVKIFLIWIIISVSVMSFVVVPYIYNNHQPIITLIILALISIPWMGFIVNSFPIIWSLAPEEEVGIYTGIYYTFNQAAYALAPVVFGGILTSFGFLGTYRYVVMFPFILICIVIAFLFMFKVKGGEANEKNI
ncbi:MAG: MFS transporter [Candidatus Lokiarchaeota archaeon]|nr:MFS transporter [Candidatus Lokiarchaeota archaeon]